jgi:DNA-directed RNA polymerase
MNSSVSTTNTIKSFKPTSTKTFVELAQTPDPRQIDHEVTAHRTAVEKFKKQVLKLRQLKYYSATVSGISSVAQLVLPFSEELADRVNKYSGRQTGPAPFINYRLEMKMLLEDVEPEVVSLIFMKSLFDVVGAFDKFSIQKVSGFIGSRIEDEARFRYYESLGCHRLTTAANKRVSTSSSNPHYRRKSTRLISEHIATEEGLPLWEAWSTPKKCGIAFFLIEIAKEAGMVTLAKPFVSPSRQQTFLVFTPKYLEIQNRLLAQVESLSFHSWPLLVPPLPWIPSTGLSRHNFSGGYHSDLCRTQLPLCRGNYNTVFSSSTTSFLNTLGRTAWCIDRDVFEVASECFEKGMTVGALKAVFDHPLLDAPMPQHLVSLPTDHEERRTWRKTKHALKEDHQKAVERSVRSREALTLARHYLNHPRFYLSWSCDYRGRAYSQQPWLNPQATEVEKAMIRFADGCKLDASGQQWVERAIGASFLGTKGSFDERQQWCQQNRDLIQAIAIDPIRTISHWEIADEPWHLLQLCLEYKRVVIDGSKALWDIPLQVDATSSGLQLLSGSLLDPVGCLYSNVAGSSSDRPEDAYMEVVKRAQQIAQSNPEWTKYVPHLNHRSLGKASLLVAVYGGAHGTRVNRIIQTLMCQNLYPEVLGWKDANAIATIIQRASVQVFPLAFAALSWIKKLGKISLENGSSEFAWSTSTGDHIALQEWESDSITINTKHLGKLKVASSFSSKLATQKMLNALAPSFVHSLDACVLKSALGDWKHPVATIHDCTAVLPAQMDRMLERLRKAYVFTVADDPLNRLADDLGVSTEQLPRLPLGTADLSTISPFLFN